MSLIKQFVMLLLFVWLGQILNGFFNVPSSVSGLVLMVMALLTGLVKVEKVADVSAWLLKISPVLFVPYFVSLLQSFDIIKPILFYFVLICVISTLITMAFTAWVLSLMEKRFK